jgi:hypothetical protein
MRRPRAARSATGIQLFPFLAVLICAMGALIVLLVLVVQQARVSAAAIRAERVQQDQAATAAETQLVRDREDADWQREVLEQQRQELAHRLSDRRLELSHLEDHIRRLEQQYAELVAEARDLERLGHARQADESTAKQELARLREEIDRERRQLETARQQAARPRSFTIIPYAGPHGTRRRPIYIECRESGIVIQPEGIVLTPEDMAGPLGPGNPLDAALRAIREHWARVEGDKAGEPYPLLIVRPDGAVAYAMARAAMAAWDSEFGYELIEADTELQYPPSDPVLLKTLPGAIAVARQRQTLLAAAMPARFGREATERFAMPDNYTKSGAGPLPEPERAAGGLAAGSRGSGSQPGAAITGAAAPTLSGPGTAAAGTSAPGTAAPGAAAPGAPAPGAAAPGTGAQWVGASGGAASGAAAPPNGSTGAPPPGTGSAAARQPTTSRSGLSQAGADSAGNGTGGAALPSMAREKGANWALRDVRINTVGITRPIAVDLYPDRIVIRPDVGDVRKPRVTRFKGPLRDSMESFVSAVWTHIESWGIAVAGGYWKPVLRVRVQPGAETRFEELQVLLKDSGLIVERRD